MSTGDSRVSRYPPGTQITFSSIAELVSFEDRICHEIIPGISAQDVNLWSGRAPIGELLRPEGYYGRIGEIVLETMPDTYQNLCNAPSRGIEFGRAGGIGGHKAELSNEISRKLITSYTGFILRADAGSTGRGKIAVITSELYYYPALRTKPKTPRHTNDTRPPTPTILAMRRIVSKPRMHEGSIKDAISQSRKIGGVLLRYNATTARLFPHNP